VRCRFCGGLDAAAPAVYKQGRHALVRGGGGVILVPFDAAGQRGHCGGGYMVTVAAVAGWLWVVDRGVVFVVFWMWQHLPFTNRVVTLCWVAVD
jgi:hypothetical protein